MSPYSKKEWAKWVERIERVKTDLQATVNDQAVFHGFGDVVRANKEWIDAHHGGYFCDFVARGYVARAAMGVRRHVKRDDDSVSLVQILTQMKDCAPQLTFDFYLEQFPRTDAEDFFWQKSTFKLLAEDEVASEKLINADIENLKRLTVQVEKFVDKELAHLDRKHFDGRVTFSDLDEAVKALDAIACKYICLLTGKGYSTLEATVQFDWTEIFKVPLEEPGARA